MIHDRRDEAILLSNNATGVHWQLGRLPPRAGAFALIGWTTEDGDGGVPASVVNALARALLQCGRVTFPCSAAPLTRSSGWRAENSDYVGTFSHRPTRGWRAVWTALRGRSELGLLSTVREEAVRGLLEDPVYPWWHNGQIALGRRPERVT